MRRTATRRTATAALCAALGATAAVAASGLAAPAAWAAASAPAAAPGAFGAANGSIDITADQSELFQEERRQVWKGSVEAIQGQDRLRTPQLTVFYAQRQGAGAGAASAGAPTSNIGKMERMEAEGPVYYITPTQNAKGDHATYVASTDTITMTGNVVLVDSDKNVVTGDRLVIEKRTGHSTLFSENHAKPQRVRGVFYQSPSSKPADAPPAADAVPPVSKPKSKHS